jgi:hypothetical protein
MKMSWLRWAATSSVACALMFKAPPTAEAGTCYVEHDWRIVPKPLTVAPPNTHVWLFAPPDWDQRICDLAHRQGEEPVCHQGPFSLRLFDAPTRETTRAQPLPTEVRIFRNAKNAVVELIPRTPLVSGRRYDVQIVDARGLEVRLASTFRVQGKPDTGAPSFRLVDPPKKPKAPKGKGRVITIDMFEYKPGIVVYGEKSADTSLFAVWAGPAGTPIDFSRPPSIYERGGQDLGGNILMDLGGSDMCGSSNFVLPRQKTIRIGFRAVDLAGNASPAADMDVTVP